MTTWSHIFKKSNEYAKTAVDQKIDEKADPKVQLEQAVEAAREQHDHLQSQASVVIGQAKQEEARLVRLNDQLGDAKTQASQALQMAAKEPDPTKQQQYNDAANTIAGQIVSLQMQVAHEQAVVETAHKNAAEAMDAIKQNAEDMQNVLQQRAELVTDLHQTEMEETLHSTMSALQATANQAVPTMDQVREKIEARKAKQEGLSEIEAGSPEHALAEIQHASVNTKAQGVLDDLRGQLGLPGPAGALTTGSQGG